MPLYRSPENVELLALEAVDVLKSDWGLDTRRAAKHVAKQLKAHRCKSKKREDCTQCRAGDLPLSEDAIRRHLDRFLERGRSAGMQADTFDAVCRVVDCLKPMAIWDVAFDDPEKKRAWDRTHESAEWMKPLNPEELESVLAELHRPEMDPVCRKVDAFRERALRQGHDPRRVDLALRRFLAPFRAYERTNGIERGWIDLDDPDERKSAVDCGLTLERIWLGRSPSSERVHYKAGDAIPYLSGGEWPEGPGLPEKLLRPAAIDDDTNREDLRAGRFPKEEAKRSRRTKPVRRH